MEKVSKLDNLDTQALLKLPLLDLVSLANKIRKEKLGSQIDLCSIVNAKSGACRENCKFCAQSSHHSSEVATYSLKQRAEFVAAARKAKEIGAERFGIVTSGNRLTMQELGEIKSALSEIKENIGITVCGSLGALSKSELKELKDAGMTRYHHNIETSENFYPQIVSTHNFQERIETIRAAKELGFEVCSGGIIGMGESWQDRIEMAKLLKELEVDSIPINFLVPIKGTPFESREQISAHDAIRTICLFRIILKDKWIKLAAGRESVLKDFQALGFMAGANGMLIGGYLTVKGRSLEEDYKLIREIQDVWDE